MGAREEMQDLLAKLATKRDELIVQANLAKLEAREEWAELEGKLAELRAKAEAAGDIAEETAEGVAASAKDVVADLQAGYERLRKLL